MGEMPLIDVSSMARLIWISTAGAAGAAIAGTAVVHAVHARAIARSAMKSVVRAATVLALAGVYIVSIVVLLGLIHLQLPQPAIGESFVTTVIVDPGILQRLIPLFAIVLTWFAMTWVRRHGAG